MLPPLTEVAVGTLKFTNKVSPDELVEVAKQLSLDLDGDGRFVDLYVRPSSNNGEFSIGFCYKYGSGEKQFKAFFHKMRHLLLRRFGAELRGWDVSSSVWIIFRGAAPI